MRNLDAYEQAAAGRTRSGLASLAPDLLYDLLDAAREAEEPADIRVITGALHTVQRTRPDAFKEALIHRIDGELFDKQLEVIDLLDGGARYLSLCCGRRSGKTKLLSRLMPRRSLAGKKGQEVVFASPTVVRSKELIWHELIDCIDTHALDWKYSESRGVVRTSDGVVIRMAGLDSARAIERFARGGNTLAFFVDEAGVIWERLKQLETAVGPALSQSMGWLIFSGTPLQVESGDWWDYCQGNDGFVPLNWTMLDNPHLGRDPQEILEEIRARKAWDEDHPEYVTEYLGRWITNPNKLVFELSRQRNCVDYAPQYDRRTWRHFIGIDYGFFPDPCAWVVLACPPHGRDVYAIHCEQHTHYDSRQIEYKTKELRDRFNPVGVVGETASGGSNFMADYNRRYGRDGGYIMPADKYDKCGGISVINTELRMPRLFFTKDVDELVDHAIRLQWANDQRTEILEGSQYPEDLPDAFRYGYLRCDAFFREEAKAAEDRHQRGIREANERAQAQAAQRRAAGRR